MSVFKNWNRIVYGDVDGQRQDAAERFTPTALAAWREAGVDDPIDMMDLEKFGIGSEVYARERAEGLTPEEIVERWGGP